ncbi:MAG: carboxypeptidase regulatory-like domain-containing protein [Vicinamibacteria bacterium]
MEPRACVLAAGLFVAALAVAPSGAQPPAQAGAARTPAPPPAELVGRVETTVAGGQKVPATGAVVWVPGVPSARSAPPAMSSAQKRFAPHVLAVAQGTVVSFPNQDKVFHNVFSRSAGSEFDLGLYRNGASRSVRFSKPGLVRVYCNIHPDMAGYVRVLEDGVFTTTDDKGAFRLPGIAPGSRVVQVWDERGGEKQFPVELEAGKSRTLNVVLDGTAFRRAPHKNKFGQDYPPVAKDVDRY